MYILQKNLQKPTQTGQILFTKLLFVVLSDEAAASQVREVAAASTSECSADADSGLHYVDREPPVGHVTHHEVFYSFMSSC